MSDLTSVDTCLSQHGTDPDGVGLSRVTTPPSSAPNSGTRDAAPGAASAHDTNLESTTPSRVARARAVDGTSAALVSRLRVDPPNSEFLAVSPRAVRTVSRQPEPEALDRYLQDNGTGSVNVSAASITCWSSVAHACARLRPLRLAFVQGHSIRCSAVSVATLGPCLPSLNPDRTASVTGSDAVSART